jgi:hypothetical protein
MEKWHSCLNQVRGDNAFSFRMVLMRAESDLGGFLPGTPGANKTADSSSDTDDTIIKLNIAK